MKIGSVEIGSGFPCRIVAEISNAHNGDRDRCRRLIDAAHKAGADIVKFQCYTSDELVALRGDGPTPEPWGSQGWTMRSLYEKARTPLDWFPKIATHCERVGMPWFSSVFGAESLALLESLGCPAYKIAALDFGKTELREMVEATRKPVIRSCSRDSAPPFMGMQLYCPPGYPQRALHLNHIRHGYDGFSYHGTDRFGPGCAVAVGAKIVEIHFMLAEEPSELEANISLDQHQFKAMVESVRRTEEMLA